ncbi:hypothetical protein GL218_05013 [Daldinia childiae]|uniref:uncharacterized protein n=1 Tax=Daldinia childiae TaxID=326645 RepID=UPI0014484E03|nr:uncharacterized protein GL218_05013 [Daldinia childiae]KAF3059806.1 hypothetical protein GL218_05013 [Daldinia childiae]
MKSLFLLLAVVIRFSPIYAQTETIGGDEPTTTESNEAVTHTVRVGLQHDFQPDTINANPGDTIRFNFYPKNHSVVRADFKKPCIPWELTNDPAETFFSGPVEQDTLQTPIPTWDLKVNSTDPVFFYCSAPGSCIDWKMVGVINPNKTFTLDIQKEFVANSTFQLSPGEEFPDESSPSSTAGSGSNPTSTPEDSSGGSGRTSLSGGAIAGIAIGGVAVIAGIVALVYICGRKGGIEKGYRRSKLMNTAPPQIVEANYNDYGAKSPPMGSPYAVSYVDPYRSPSPGAISSQVGSPHNSYLGHPSPGIPPYAPVSPPFPGQEQYPLL